ncbi:hypothetical protein FRB90_000923 [Tulasnella sp. 427]|nr:hypothetical protein FRB90_000923 [Tulasnella sp. 427]
MVSIQDLPYELILTIVEAGGLDITDIFALRQTCQWLFQISQSPIFWVAVSEYELRRGYPFPFPPFTRPLLLTGPEWVRLACRHQRTRKNLKSEVPVPRKHTRLGAVSLHNFIILPGGTYVLTSDEAGGIAIRNIQTLLIETDTGPITGDIVAFYQVKGEPLAMNYHFHGQDERKLIVCVVHTRGHGYALDIICFEFTQIIAAGKQIERVATSVLLQIPRTPASRILAVEVQGDLVAVLEEPSINDPLYLVFVDHTNNAILRINTGIEGSKDAYDMYILDGNCVICRAGTRETDILVYLDADNLVRLNQGSLDQKPHFAKTIKHNDAAATSTPLNRDGTDVFWVPSRPWNTPSRWNANRFLLLSTSDERDAGPFEDIINHPMLLAQWLDPPTVISWVQDSSESPCPFTSRTFVSFPDRQTRVSHNGILLSPSTCWRRMIWISGSSSGSAEVGDPHPSLTMIPLPTPEEAAAAAEVKAGCKDLNIPIDLSTAKFVKFSDEAGLLAVGLNVGTPNGVEIEQEVHLFCGEDERDLVVCLVSVTSLAYTVDVVCFKFVRNLVAESEIETVVSSLLIRIPEREAFRIGALEVQEDIVAVLVEISLDGPLCLSLADYRKNSFSRINTGIDGSKDTYNMYLSEDRCVIYTTGPQETKLHIYCDLKNLISLNKESLDQEPHFSKIITHGDIASTIGSLNPSGTQGFWHPCHRPFNTPSRWTADQLILLYVNEQDIDNQNENPEESSPNYPPVLLVGWLHPLELGRWMQGGFGGPSPFDNRTIITLPRLQTRLQTYGPILILSTCCKHLTWIGDHSPRDEDPDGAGTRFVLIKLPSPGEPNTDTPDQANALCRDLNVPIDLSEATYVRFSDDSGLLAVSLNKDEDYMEQELHLFWY